MKGATPPRGTAVVGSRIAVLQNELLVGQILQHFGERELMALRPVCRMFRHVAERYLWARYTSFQGVSSVVPAQGTTDKTLYAAVVDRLLSVNVDTGSLRIASDQITDAAFIRRLLGPMLELTIDFREVLHFNVGSKAPPEGVGSLPGDAAQVAGPTREGKAHAKFISGGGGALITSANLTPTALSGKTVESGVIVQSQLVQAYLNRYWQLMRGGSREEDAQFERMLAAFNSRRHKMRLALAPFVEIQPWLLAELAGADRIVIRMFLISHLGYGDDIVSGINAMARKNPKMQVSVFVDAGQYDNTEGTTVYFDGRRNYKQFEKYVQVACHKLMSGAPNVKVFKQSRSTGIMHDKLILAETDMVVKSGTGEMLPVTHKRVILGSSGFSTHVMHNSNFDMMVAIDEAGLFDYLMGHHAATLRSKDFPTSEVKRPA